MVKELDDATTLFALMKDVDQKRQTQPKLIEAQQVLEAENQRIAQEHEEAIQFVAVVKAKNKVKEVERKCLEAKEEERRKAEKVEEERSAEIRRRLEVQKKEKAEGEKKKKEEVKKRKKEKEEEEKKKKEKEK